MTVESMRTFFEGLVEDSIDDDLLINLFNRAKDEVEAAVDWEVLKALDSTQIATPSDTFNTNPKGLPSNFYLPRKLYVGEDPNPYDLIPFEGAHRYRNVARKWYMNLHDLEYFLTGSPVSKNEIIYLYYVIQSVDFTVGEMADTSWSFPSKFHYLIPFKAAELYYPKDQTELGRSWDKKWLKEYRDLWNAALQWDARLKVLAHQGQGSEEDYSADANKLT